MLQRVWHLVSSKEHLGVIEQLPICKDVRRLIPGHGYDQLR